MKGMGRIAARIILGCMAGEQVQEIARRCQTRPNTVIKWRGRFAEHGLKGVDDAPRPGAQRVYDEDFRHRVLAMMEKSPPSCRRRARGCLTITRRTAVGSS